MGCLPWELRLTATDGMNNFNMIFSANRGLCQSAFGNDHLVEKLEAEGAEVCVPELMGFIKYCAYNGMVKEKLLKSSKKAAFFNHQFLNLVFLTALSIGFSYSPIISNTFLHRYE